MVKTAPIKILLADPHQMFLDLLVERFAREPGLDVVGAATSADEALRRANATRPQVLLSELHFDDRGAIDLAEDLLRRHEALRIVFLSGFVAEVFVEQAARLSAGYILKSEPLEAVVTAIRKAAGGETPQSISVAQTGRLLEERRRFSASGGDSLSALTSRQIQMIREYAHGLSVKEVGEKFGLSEKGAESQKSRIMEKLGVHNRVELTRYAIREGLVAP